MKKIGLLCLALVLALGTLGVGYAMWAENLEVNATVETGEVNAEFTRAFTDDDGNPDDPAIDPNDDNTGEIYDYWGDLSSRDPKESKKIPERGDKDVARSYAELVDPQHASLTIENAYPSYYTSGYFELENTGSIPVVVLEVWEHANFDHWVSWDCGETWEDHFASEWYKWPPGTVPCTEKHVDINGDGVPEFNIHITQLERGKQIDPGETVIFDVDFHLKQAAGEGEFYTFDERVEVGQWNEYEPVE